MIPYRIQQAGKKAIWFTTPNEIEVVEEVFSIASSRAILKYDVESGSRLKCYCSQWFVFSFSFSSSNALID